MSKKKEHKKSIHSIQPKIEVSAEKKRNKNIIILIFLISFLFYGNTIPNEFSMDDELVTLNHKNTSKGISGIGAIFKERYVSNEQQKYEYRPIVLVTFAIEHQFTGGNPHFSHFINILLYALTGVVLFFLLSKLFLNYHWILPASITFLFLIHPIHNEVVASLKNRDELLSFLFTLLSIRAFIYFIDTQDKKQILYGFIFFAISVLSKRSSVPLIATLPIILFYFRNLSFKKALLFISVPLLFMIILKIITSLYIENVDRPGLYYENPMYVDKLNLIEKIPVIFYCIGFYIKLLIIPYPLVLYYGYSTVPIAGWDNVFSIISMIILIPLSIYCLVKMKEKKIWMFGFLYFMINAGAFSNIVPMPGIVGERFVYGASLGFFIMIVPLFFELLKIDISKEASLKIPQPLKYVTLLLVMVYGIYIFDRNKDWKNHLTTYQADVLKVPNSAKLHALIGGYCMQEMEIHRINPEKKKLTQQDINNYIALSNQHFKSALSILPDYIACLNNLGTLYYSYYGQPDSAYTYFKKITELDSTHLQSHFNLGSYYELEYGNYTAFESFASSNYNDSLYSDIVLNSSESINFDKFYLQTKVIFQIQKTLVYEATNVIQQYINASRQVSGGTVEAGAYITAYNNKWSSTITNNKFQPSNNLNPGKALFDFLFSDQAKNQEELVFNLGKIVNQNFLLEFNDVIKNNFKNSFGKEMGLDDFAKLHKYSQKKKTEYKLKSITEFNTALFMKGVYSPAYTKLSTIYTQEKMWDSLISLNKKLSKRDDIYRFVDIHKILGNSYLNKGQIELALNYYQKAVEEEEIILNHIILSSKGQSAAGNNIALNKLNQLYFKTRNGLFETYSYMGKLYSEQENPNKANECYTKANSFAN